jgi:hypothetical protein
MKSTAFFMNFVMLAIFVTMVGVAAGYPPQARFMPFVVGIPAIALCILQIFLDLRNFRTKQTPSAAQQEPASFEGLTGETAQAAAAAQAEASAINTAGIPPGMVRREITLWAYFLSLIGGILLFGFWPTIPVFLLIFLHFEAELKWPKAFLVAAIGFTILYLAVAKGLRVELHQGFITSYLIDRFGLDG